jgi:hypothetical protein
MFEDLYDRLADFLVGRVVTGREVFGNGSPNPRETGRVVLDGLTATLGERLVLTDG